MIWLRKDGELYLAVKVVDQEVNRLDRVRFLHLHIPYPPMLHCIGEHRGVASGTGYNVRG